LSVRVGSPSVAGSVRRGQELHVAAEALVFLGEPQVVAVLPAPGQPVAGDQRQQREVVQAFLAAARDVQFEQLLDHFE